jgi:hypothetical protein
LRLVTEGKMADVATGFHDEEIYEKPGHLVCRESSIVRVDGGRFTTPPPSFQQIAVAIFVAETKAFDITPVQYASLLAVQWHRPDHFNGSYRV